MVSRLTAINVQEGEEEGYSGLNLPVVDEFTCTVASREGPATRSAGGTTVTEHRIACWRKAQAGLVGAGIHQHINKNTHVTIRIEMHTP